MSKYSNFSGGGMGSNVEVKDSDKICKGNIGKKIICSTETSTTTPTLIPTPTYTKKEIVATTIGTGSEQEGVDFPCPSNSENTEKDIQKEENERIDMIMGYFEKMRKESPEKFGEVLMINKKFVDTVNNYKGKKDLEILDSLINSINYNIDLLYWSFNKTVKVAILEKKNIELVHFFIIKHRIRLDTFFFRYIITDYIESFRYQNFIEIEDEKIEIYTCIFEMLITAGKAYPDLPNTDTRKTPFHLAVEYNQYQFILFLGRLGVNIDHFDKDFKTPLDIAIDKSLQEDYVAKAIVDLLMSWNARAFKHFDYKPKVEVIDD
jgi:hypothetical protein